MSIIYHITRRADWQAALAAHAYTADSLASEGFISDDYRWLHSTSGNLLCRVRWLVDPAWWKPGPEVEAFTFRFMVRVLAYSALLWLVLMVLVFCRIVR